jgi:hypothetical protein
MEKRNAFIKILSDLRQSILLPWALSILPILLYLWYINAFGVNVIFWDEWNLIPMIHHFFLGDLTFFLIWDQHNENRMLIPNLFFLLLANIAHFNTKIGMFVGAFFLIVTFTMIYTIYRKHFPKRIWAFVPISYLMFSLVQYENVLWGFQVAWYMILSCLLGMLVYLDRADKSVWTFSISIILAILASFSSFQGLFLWPVGLLYIFSNEYSSRSKALWIVFALITVILYFTRFDFHNTGGTPIFGFLSHPINALIYFFVTIGSVLPIGSDGTKGIIGILLFFLSSYYTVRAISSVKLDRGYLLPLALIFFVILFDCSLVIGRSGFGISQATSSRYTTYNLLLLIAIYISAIRDVSSSFIGGKLKSLSAIAVGIAVAIQIPSSYVTGLHKGRDLYTFRTKAADILFGYKTASSKMVENYLWSNTQLVIQRSALADQYRLSVFQEKK